MGRASRGRPIGEYLHRVDCGDPATVLLPMHPRSEGHEGIGSDRPPAVGELGRDHFLEDGLVRPTELGHLSPCRICFPSEPRVRDHSGQKQPERTSCMTGQPSPQSNPGWPTARSALIRSCA